MQASTIRSIFDDVEDLWSKCDILFEELTHSNSGPSISDAFPGIPDLFYHLACFDQEIIARPLELGVDLPPEERWGIHTLRELKEWWDWMDARRPVDQTMDQSRVQMHDTRNFIRKIVSRMTDADLERPVWSHLLVIGWKPARFLVEGLRSHTWSEFIALRMRMGRALPEPPPTATRAALGQFVQVLPLFLTQRAPHARLTLVMDFSGPGGAAWTFQLADGVCQVVEGRAERPDLIVTQSPETFIATRQQALDVRTGINTGRIAVTGSADASVYVDLFAPISVATVQTPMADARL